MLQFLRPFFFYCVSTCVLICTVSLQTCWTRPGWRSFRPSSSTSWICSEKRVVASARLVPTRATMAVFWRTLSLKHSSRSFLKLNHNMNHIWTFSLISPDHGTTGSDSLPWSWLAFGGEHPAGSHCQLLWSHEKAMYSNHCQGKLPARQHVFQTQFPVVDYIN